MDNTNKIKFLLTLIIAAGASYIIYSLYKDVLKLKQELDTIKKDINKSITDKEKKLLEKIENTKLENHLVESLLSNENSEEGSEEGSDEGSEEGSDEEDNEDIGDENMNYEDNFNEEMQDTFIDLDELSELNEGKNGKEWEWGEDFIEPSSKIRSIEDLTKEHDDDSKILELTTPTFVENSTELLLGRPTKGKNGWSLQELKEYCSNNNLPIGGKKDDLIRRIQEHLSSK